MSSNCRATSKFFISGVRGPHEHHGNGGLGEDPLGHATQQDPANAASPRGADHDQVGAERLRFVEDLGGGSPKRTTLSTGTAAK